jgi:hypothetical protein
MERHLAAILATDERDQDRDGKRKIAAQIAAIVLET